jgi:uncharacterized protein involved in exopolysaccharide biosynthesis
MDSDQSVEDPPATAETQRVGSRGAAHAFTELSDADGGEQSGLGEYLHILWKRKAIIIVTFVVVVGGVLAYCVSASKSYTASATVFLEPPVSNLFQNGGASSSATPLVNVQDQIQIMESSAVSDIVARTIPNPPSASVTQVGSLATTDVVSLSVSSGNRQTAAAAANAYANAYINYERGIDKAEYLSAAKQVTNKVNTLQIAINDLDNTIRATPAGLNQTANEVQLSDLENQLTALQDQLQGYQFASTQGQGTEVGRVISLATVPSSPSSPHTTEYVVIAAIFGLIGGVALALIVNAVSRRRI